ncbi:MAG: ROK family transcriptional regulator [Oscillospiraceae bacterium]|nr:ROK family transcriptional regulator [Oscillospiraceae bacterium]
MAKGLNLKSLKSKNRSLLLYLLNDHGDLSRKEIAAKLSLTPAAVTKICNELIKDGFIKELGEIEEQGKSGRREVLLGLCLRDKLVLGVNTERNGITYSLSNLEGELIGIKRDEFCADIETVTDKAKDFLQNFRIDIDRVIGAGICIIGAVGENDFGIWKNGNIKEKFEAALGIPVTVENNVKAFAQSELIYGKTDKSKSILFLKWGPGIGSSIATFGKVHSGNDSGIAEIGHYIVNVAGKKCRCGRFGCLETEASSEEIISEAGGSLSLEEIVNSDRQDTVYLLDHKIDLVALALSNTATILNAESIILFGSLFDNDRIIKKLAKQCIRYNRNFSNDIIKISSLNDKREYIGAVAICAKKYFFEKY